MSSSTSRTCEQRSSGTREVARATSSDSKPRIHAATRLEHSVHSPTVATLGGHVHELVHEEPRGARPRGGSEPRGGSPRRDSGCVLSPRRRGV